MRNVLTGFKWIGDQIANLEAAGEVDRFIFGFEESYGYLAGPYVRDKDAIIGSMLICEMAAYYRSIGSSIKAAPGATSTAEYGRYLNKVDSFEFPGLTGMDKMAAIMQKLRDNPPTELGWPQGGQGDRLQEAGGDGPARRQCPDLQRWRTALPSWCAPPAPSPRSRPTSPPWARIWPRHRPRKTLWPLPLSPS